MVDNTREQKLIYSLSRGGFTSISEDCQHLVYKTEELFRKETAVANLPNIDIAKITLNLMSQSDIISLIDSITDISGCNIDLEIRNNLFEKMIQLYLRVRSFSLARDITFNKKKFCATLRLKYNLDYRKYPSEIFSILNFEFWANIFRYFQNLLSCRFSVSSRGHVVMWSYRKKIPLERKFCADSESH